MHLTSDLITLIEIVRDITKTQARHYGYRIHHSTVRVPGGTAHQIYYFKKTAIPIPDILINMHEDVGYMIYKTHKLYRTIHWSDPQALATLEEVLHSWFKIPNAHS